jgi:translocation and assembly module TamA
MRGPHTVAPALLLAVSLSCGARQKPAGPIVRDLTIEGNRALSDRQIKKKILTAETAWWPFATKHAFDPIIWQSDLKRIARLYQSHGYFQAEVTRDAAQPSGDGVELTAEVREGERTLVETLDVTGLEALPEEDRRAALRGLPLEAGKPFVEDRWREAAEGLKQRLRDAGYAEAEAHGRALVDVNTRRARLTIEVMPGERYQFGEINVEIGGGTAISPVWVWEEVRLAIAEGEVYSREALVEAQRRVSAMGVFAAVDVTTGKPDPATRRIPVVVLAREAPFRSLRLGGGARVDQIRNEVRALAEWSHRNFLGGMRRLTTRVEAGWAFIPNAYEVYAGNPDLQRRNGPVARVRVELEQPRFLGRPSLRGRSLLEGGRTMELAYDMLGARLVNGVVWRPRTTLSVYPSYHLEAYKLDGAANTGTLTAPLTLGCETLDNTCVVWLSFLEEVVTWDRRDDILEPRRGWYASLSLQQGGGPLQGDFTYYRFLPDLRGYVSFGEEKKLTLAARVRVGELVPTSGNPDDTAVMTRMYSGGTFSMRGFNERRLSPLLLVTPLPTSATPNPVSYTVPIGGNGLVDGSFEARYPLSESLVLSAFVDFGQVTRGRLGVADLRTMLVAVGLGLRYRTPVGPVRVDLGRRLQIGEPPPLLVQDMTGVVSQLPYAVNDSCFGLGGSGRTTVVGDSLCVLHIAIGEAF